MRTTKNDLKERITEAETLIKAVRVLQWTDKETTMSLLAHAVDKIVTFGLELDKWVSSYKKHQGVLEGALGEKLAFLRQYDSILGNKKINSENLYEIQFEVAYVISYCKGALNL